MIRKAVIPAAGLGTRLLPATMEEPKEMLPIFALGINGQIYVKPLLQLVFEQLYDGGIREFCFITGKTKRAIEDHFTQDYEYIAMLKRRSKFDLAEDLESFYKKLEDSRVVWINQPEPKGFGEAVHRARAFIGDEEFLVHAGDTYIITREGAHLKRLVKIHQELDADATLLLQRMEDPRQYGIVEVEKLAGENYRVNKAIEKPEKPTSKLAIMPIYIFRPVIFEALEKTPPGKGEEIQLTDGIQMLIDWKRKVYAIKLKPDENRLDIGSPETYWHALRLSYQHATR
jgi:UTP--glucose-1-phosphate uridylyltransferase